MVHCRVYQSPPPVPILIQHCTLRIIPKSEYVSSYNYCRLLLTESVPVAARSKAQVCAARLLKLLVRIPLQAWMSVCCECCVLSGRGLCGGPISRPEEYYRLWSVVVCDLETSCTRRPWPTGAVAPKTNCLQE
jgi:hypothetical protein